MALYVLGPLEVRADGTAVPITGAIPRLILTVLAARRGTTVSADALTDIVWGNDQPANPKNALHTQISHLRRALRPLEAPTGRVLVTVPGGYRLEVPSAEVDAERFEQAVVTARQLSRSSDATDLARASELVESALALWRGEPLVDGAGHVELAPDVARLHELRVVALETRGKVLLELGRHVELVPDAQRAVADHPLHEPLHAQLAVALYRSGRQAEALRAVAEARRLLVEEVGMDPGAELRHLEQQLLAHAPELDLTAPTVSAGDPSASRPGSIAGPPPLVRHHQPRQRLDKLLEEATEVTTLVVSAPAGAGKSEALAGWLTRRAGGGAWLAVTADSNDPAVFWPAMAAALRLPGAGELRSGRAVLAALQAPSRAGGPEVLVIDDYHLVTNPAIHAEVDAWLRAPSDVHLVIGTRHDPPLRLADLRARGQLREVRFEALRFTEAELEGLLEAVAGRRLPIDDVRQLLARTEGWAVGVQLAAVSLRTDLEPSAFVQDFAGDDRHVADYLRDEVLSRVDDRLRRFLLDTSILDRFSPSLCAAVTGDEKAGSQLEELERLNLFLLPLDHRREWYRYHALFAEWLRLQPAGDVRERHRRAACWLAEHNFAADAIRHHLAAGDGEAAAELIERERWLLVGQGRQHTLRDWIRLLPDAVFRSRPRLITAAAWVAYNAGHWDDVAHLVELVDVDDLRPEHDDQLLRAEVALLTAGRLAAVGDLPSAGAIAAAALTSIPQHEPRARCGLLLVLGKSQLAEGDLAAARRAFTEAARLAEPYQLSIVEVIAHAHLAELLRREGRSPEAERSAKAALDMAASAGLSDHPECAVPHLTLANLLLDAGRRTEAEDALQRGGELAELIPYEPRETFYLRTRHRLTGVPPGGDHGAGEPLTTKERALLRLLPSSLTPREIAAELYVSLNTVKSHTRTLYRKLGVNNRHAAIERARQRKLL